MMWWRKGRPGWSPGGDEWTLCAWLTSFLLPAIQPFQPAPGLAQRSCGRLPGFSFFVLLLLCPLPRPREMSREMSSIKIDLEMESLLAFMTPDVGRPLLCRDHDHRQLTCRHRSSSGTGKRIRDCKTLPRLFLSQVPRRIPVLTFISPCLLQLHGVHGGTGKRLDSRVRRAQWRMQVSKCPNAPGLALSRCQGPRWAAAANLRLEG